MAVGRGAGGRRRKAGQRDRSGSVTRLQREAVAEPGAPTWTSAFRDRMESFRAGARRDPARAAVSVKIRVTSGCFHREHSPHAYTLIDDALRADSPSRRSFQFIEHESGPEILVYVAAATAVITLTKSVIDLIVVILRARSEGIRKGDRPSHPLEVVVRRSVDRGRVDEEFVLRIDHSDTVNPAEVRESLRASVERLLTTRAPGKRKTKRGAPKQRR